MNFGAGSSGLLALLLTAGAAVADQNPGPEEFAYVVPVQVSDVGRLARMLVPREAYLESRVTGLGDLRLFDPEGRVVVHELRPTTERSTIRWHPLAWTVLRSDADSAASEFFLRREGETTELRIVDGHPVAEGVPQWVVDLRDTARPVSRLRLRWRTQEQGFIRPLRVEASDDLSNWRSVTTRAVVAEWALDGRRVVHNEVVIQPVSGGYLRLRLEQTPALELEAIDGGVADRVPVEPYWLRLDPATARRDGAAWTFDSGGRVPVDRLQLQLPDALASLPVRISSRAHAGARWVMRIEETAYRVRTANAEITNPPWRVTRGDTLWRVEPLLGTGGGAPGLRLGWQPQALVFAPSKPGRYLLAFGRPGTSPPPPGLLTRLERDRRLLPPEGWLESGPVRIQAAAAQLPPVSSEWRTGVLWLVLVSGVLLVGWLALRLIRHQVRADTD